MSIWQMHRIFRFSIWTKNEIFIQSHRHNNWDVCGSTEKEFIVDHCNKIKPKYTLQVGDECIVAPLSLFHTELLNITRPGKLAKVQKPSRQQPDPEDCFDAEYLRETGVRNPLVSYFFINLSTKLNKTITTN